MPLKLKKNAVRAPYTFAKLKQDVLARRAANPPETLRSIALDFGVSHATIQRVAAGHEPQSASIRAALGLPATVAVPVCPHCGQPPLSKRHTCGDKFSRNAARYNEWKAAQMPNILDILNWAESKGG